tara:strand:- start:5158 stop:5466 length:309 start_codon:yes stop_codon:yes gene_type:complete
MSIESKEELETWKYLRSTYYMRFKQGIIKLPWDIRFDVLKELHGEWENQGEDPVEAMMEYVFDKGYFTFFCRGVEVSEDGSFKLHKLISANLGSVGIYDEWF